jgi:dipeptidyl aminopeptidase/acylaminoacyl peptidase
MRILSTICLLLLVSNSVLAQGQRMTPELLWKLGRLGEADLSADGDSVAFTVRRYDLAENKGRSELLIHKISAKESTRILDQWASISDIQFVSGDNGELLYFSGSKTGDDVPQAWVIKPGNAEPLQVTQIEDGIANLKVSPTGQHLAYTSDVKMDKTVNELFEDLPFADARIIDGLMYRHWNAWHDYKYSHLFFAPIDTATGQANGAIDLMAGIKADCPVPPFGGSEQFNWSPDGQEIAYTAKIVNNWAESTDSDIYLRSIKEQGSAECITTGMDGYDNDPVYSPDGRYVSFQSMEQPGFESDRNRVMLYDRQTKSIVDATAGLDQTTHGVVWAPNSSRLYFNSEYRGTDQVFELVIGQQGATQKTKGTYNWQILDVFPDGERVLISYMDMVRPAELAIVRLSNGIIEPITSLNEEHFANLELPSVEQRWVRASDGKQIHCWVIFPPNFDPSKQYPMLTYCQGGPQGQIGQWFSYRWNFHLMAAKGYVILAPNRRGLPGFGRQWNDDISGDWGGQAMKDILSATDALMAEPYIDNKRVAAIGASFGGYTVYWLMGNSADRFCSMVAHCGVFNLESMYGSTEELFFVNWDLGGPYWKSQELQEKYNQFSPNRFVGNWKTPLLVVHGEKDFRVPVTQGMEAFTAAQVQGVPSRFLYYPNEGHWVMQPQNGVLWHRVFFDWLDRFCKPEK